MDDLLKTEETTARDRRGASPARLRQHNERMVLSLLRDRGAMAGSEIAKGLNMSAQTASVLIRALEDQRLILKLAPVKGKVGKPQTPVALNPNGAFSFGLRIGRRSANVILVNFLGDPIAEASTGYRYPTPEAIETFCAESIQKLSVSLPAGASECVVGLGIAAPFELWNWLEWLGAPAEEAAKWRGYTFGDGFSKFTDLPVFFANDVNQACTGELMFGHGRQLRDFIYFYVGSFIGGAIVLNGGVFGGARGNAGAFGSIPTGSRSDPKAQLIASASLITLERNVGAKLGKPVNIRTSDWIWQAEPALVETWLSQASEATARAALSVVAALDINEVVIDGMFPPEIKETFVDRIRDASKEYDARGIAAPRFNSGLIGPSAGALGAAYQPLMAGLLAEGSDLVG